MYDCLLPLAQGQEIEECASYNADNIQHAQLIH